MIKTFLFSLLCFLMLGSTFSCKPAAKETEEVAETPTTETATTATEEIYLPYPALGNPIIAQLYAETEKVDIIFYNLPISVNQDDPGSAKSTVLYVSPTHPKVTANCKPIARLSWIGDGKILREADVYLDTGCEYMMFMEGNEGVAINAMSPGGVDFFRNIINQVDQQTR